MKNFLTTFKVTFRTLDYLISVVEYNAHQLYTVDISLRCSPLSKLEEFLIFQQKDQDQALLELSGRVLGQLNCTSWQ